MHSHRLAHGKEGPASIPVGKFDARVDLKMLGCEDRSEFLKLSHAILKLF